MRKAGAGAAGLADSSPRARPRRPGDALRDALRGADFADFAKERKGKDPYERAKAEKAMAEGGDGWRPGAHDEALDSAAGPLRRRRRPDRDAGAGADARGDFRRRGHARGAADGRPLLLWAATGRAAGDNRRAARRDRRRARRADAPDFPEP